jgi:large subunit ribosomal protein L32
MAEPKQRLNNSKQGMRRMHDKIKHLSLSFCEQCHEAKEPHKVCYNCGTYKKETVIKTNEK